MGDTSLLSREVLPILDSINVLFWGLDPIYNLPIGRFPERKINLLIGEKCYTAMSKNFHTFIKISIIIMLYVLFNNMLKGNKLKQEYRTLSFVYFDTHQLYNNINNINNLAD